MFWGFLPSKSDVWGSELQTWCIDPTRTNGGIAAVCHKTNGRRWPVFQFAFMFVLAWVLAFLTWQGGRLLGWAKGWSPTSLPVALPCTRSSPWFLQNCAGDHAGFQH